MPTATIGEFAYVELPKGDTVEFSQVTVSVPTNPVMEKVIQKWLDGFQIEGYSPQPLQDIAEAMVKEFGGHIGYVPRPDTTEDPDDTVY